MKTTAMYNFKLFIPNNLIDKIYSEQDYQGDNTVFKFYYHDSLEKEPKNIFTISVSPKIIAEESKGISITNKSLTVLGEDYDNVFTLQINDEAYLLINLPLLEVAMLLLLFEHSIE